MPHTKGPFEVVDYGRGMLRIEAKAVGGALATVWPTDPKTRKRSPEFIGNAYLFAAAPDMLEALHTAAERLDAFVAIDSGGANTSALDEVRAAIAKAKGPL